jgi:hypothetical protein
MAKELPVFKITIDDQYAEDGQDLGIEQIAFTSDPAIIVKGIAFNSHSKKLAFADKYKMRIAAPALIPMNIYRKDEDGEYEVQFTVEEIEAIHSKFMKDLNNTNLFNLEHDQSQTVPAYILEAWIVEDPETDKSFKTFNTKVPKGSLFVVSQITDEVYFKSLVDNDQIGYSIEGFLGLKLKEHKNKNKYNMELPEGAQFKIGEVAYIVKDGKVVEDIAPAIDATESKLAEDVPAEQAKPEEVVEEKMSEEVVEETKMEDVKPAEVVEEKMTEVATLDETAILAIIQPKLDEIYKMIADLKAEEVTEELIPTQEVKMSAHQSFMNMQKFINK